MGDLSNGFIASLSFLIFANPIVAIIALPFAENENARWG
jgi:hypothetical protein